MSQQTTTADTVKRLAADLGFALCGIAEARPTDHREHIEAWLAAGLHGEMRWLANHVDARCDPRQLLPGARSVICVADHIGPSGSSPAGGGWVGEAAKTAHDRIAGDDTKQSSVPSPNPSRGEGGPHSEFGKIARYAQVDDYHKVIKKRLIRLADALRADHPDERFRVCVDTAPILEREHAHRAGIGWVGKSTLLIHPNRGSHLLLGEIVTTLGLEPDEPEADHCGTCTRCIDACPTACITPYAVDAARCISYLTIEHRGAIDESLHTAMGDWLYGCDVCQDVCPYNTPDRGAVGERPIEAYGPGRPAGMDPLAILSWTEHDRRSAFTRSAMKRAKLDQMKRNALIVAGNIADSRGPAARAALAARVDQIAEDELESDIVRSAARAVRRTIRGSLP